MLPALDLIASFFGAENIVVEGKSTADTKSNNIRGDLKLFIEYAQKPYSSSATSQWQRW